MDDNKMFALKEDCFLVKGAKRGAIYNLASGDIYSIDEHATALIEKSESGLTLSEVLKDQSDEIKQQAMCYLKYLVDIGTGSFIQTNKTIQKIPLTKPHPLQFVWLEVTKGCNLKCIHCSCSGSPSLLNNGRMRELDWIRAINESYEIGCRKIQFTGGEPFAIGPSIFRLINVCKDLGYEFIEVYTNATLINDAAIQFLATNKVSVATSIYADNANIHDQITKCAGSFERTINTIKKLAAKNINIRVGLIVMNINESHISKTISFLKEELGIKNIKIDSVRPSGRGKHQNIIQNATIKKIGLSEPCFPKCTMESFQLAMYGHNCFSKELCVNADGNVLPCVMERDVVLGNILDSSLLDIIQNDQSKNIRDASKDKVLVCRDCEYRYCCFDCRPRARGNGSKDFFAKPINCSYNPYDGRWVNQQ